MLALSLLVYLPLLHTVVWGDRAAWAILSGLGGIWVPHIAPRDLTSRANFECSECPIPRRIPGYPLKAGHCYTTMVSVLQSRGRQ
jgi:hypothetical protein